MILTDQRGISIRLIPARIRLLSSFPKLARVILLWKRWPEAASTLSKGRYDHQDLGGQTGGTQRFEHGHCLRTEENVLPRLAQGEAIGTQLTAVQALWHARANWLADQLRAQGASGA